MVSSSRIDFTPCSVHPDQLSKFHTSRSSNCFADASKSSSLLQQMSRAPETRCIPGKPFHVCLSLTNWNNVSIFNFTSSYYKGWINNLKKGLGFGVLEQVAWFFWTTSRLFKRFFLQNQDTRVVKMFQGTKVVSCMKIFWEREEASSTVWEKIKRSYIYLIYWRISFT